MCSTTATNFVPSSAPRRGIPTTHRPKNAAYGSWRRRWIGGHRRAGVNWPRLVYPENTKGLPDERYGKQLEGDSPFHPVFDLNRCDYLNGCKLCAKECSFGEISMEPVKGRNGEVSYRPRANLAACNSCQRCVKTCPHNAIHIEYQPMHTSHGYWTPEYAGNIWRQAGAGGGAWGNVAASEAVVLTISCSMPARSPTPPSILREPMEIRRYLGRKPDRYGEEIGPQLKLDVPIMFGAMSFGAVNKRVQEGSAMTVPGTYWNTGEGGFYKDLRRYGENTIVQVASTFRGQRGLSEISRGGGDQDRPGRNRGSGGTSPAKRS